MTKETENNKAKIDPELLIKLIKLQEDCPLVPHTNAGRLYSTVRRMTAEKELDIPIRYRTGFPVSVKTGKNANEMDVKEWEEFYSALSEQLNTQHSNLYNKIFKRKGEKNKNEN
jgi:hypothetical protein